MLFPTKIDCSLSSLCRLAEIWRLSGAPIASAVLAIAILWRWSQNVDKTVCCFGCFRVINIAIAFLPSVCLSVTRRYSVKTSERRMMQTSLKDSKMCLVLRQPKKIPPRDDLSPEILAQTDPPPPKSSEFWQVLPCSASTARDRKRSSITVNKKSTRAFQRAINQHSTLPLTSSKWGSNT